MHFVLVTLSCLLILCYVQSQVTEEYYGKEVGVMKTLAHRVKGIVYIVDSKRLRVRDFHYDGTAPAAFFWIGLKGKHGSEPDKNGIAIPNELGRMIVLKKYESADLVLTLPSNITVDQLRWFSVWCQVFLIDFGHVIFPEILSIPAAQDIGRFSPLGHSVSSGEVTLLDHKTALVKSFAYDGQAKEVFFVAGNGTNPTDSTLLIKVPRINGRLEPLPAFSGTDVTLRFPGPTSVFLFRFLAVYSNETGQTFGQVTLPDKLNIPPFTLDPVIKLP